LPTGKTKFTPVGLLTNPDTLNIYRTAYGFQLDEKRLQAIAAYQQLLHNFPDAKETGTALLQLANMANQKMP